MGQISCKTQLENPNTSLYSAELWEEAKGQCSFFRSSQAAVIFRFTFGLSAVSAFLIIYIILRSPTRLSSIYHRIMFAMGLCQMITSIATGLTTLPMPAPGDYWTDIVNVQGTRLGNTFTCTAQGFLSRFGDESSGSYFVFGLSFYYVCAIGLEMNIDTLTKYIEPLIHIFCISLGLLPSLPPLFVGGYNVIYDTMYCTVTPKPWFCDSSNSSVACVRGGVGEGKQLLTDQKLACRSDPPIIACVVLCLLIVCCRVYKKDREMATLLRDWDIHNDGRRHLRNLHGKPGISMQLKSGVYLLRNGEEISLEEIRQRIKDQYKDTKVIVSQSALYFSLQIFLLGSELSFAVSAGPLSMSAFIWSLQGFYQLFIFIFHKVFNQRRHDNNISISKAIIAIFQGGHGDDAFIISGLYAVEAINRVNESGNIGYSVQSGFSEDLSESRPILSSYDLLDNFGSTPLADPVRSLIPTSVSVADDNANISPRIIQYHSYISYETSRLSKCSGANNDGLTRFSGDSNRLSGFSEELGDGNQFSLEGCREEVISDHLSTSTSSYASI